MLHPMDMPLRLANAVYDKFRAPAEFYLPVPERLMWMVGLRDNSEKFMLIVVDMNVQVTFDRRSLRQMRSIHNRPLPTWARPAAASLRLLMDNDWLLQGGRFMVAGDEPLGARYEHAIALGFLAYWHDVFKVPYDFVDLLDLADLAARRYLQKT